MANERPDNGSSIITVPDRTTLAAFIRLLGVFRNSDERFKSAHIRALLENMAAGDKFYDEFEIPKGRGRTRPIEAPINETLIGVQDDILKVLNCCHLPAGVYGFRRNWSAPLGLRRMIDNIDQHGSLEAVYSLDIKDFFPSVTKEQVRQAVWHFFWRMLHRWEDGPELKEEIIDKMAVLVADLCCLRGRLPQGACTSPILANMVGVRFDRRICEVLAEEPGYYEYGRYADDIVVMGTQHITEKLRGLIESIISSCGFRVSYPKRDYREGHKHFPVWGVDVYPAYEKDGYDLHFRLPRRKVKKYEAAVWDLVIRDDLPEGNRENKKGEEEKGEGEGDDSSLPTPEVLSSFDMVGEEEGAKEDEKVEEGEGEPFDSAQGREEDYFIDHEDVQRVLGYLSYASIVTRFGKNHPRVSEFCLPKRLVLPWQFFYEKYKDRLPKKAKKWFKYKASDFQKSVEYVPTTPEILQRRVEALCGKKDYNFREFREAVGELKTAILAKYEAEDDGDKPFFDVNFTSEMIEGLLDPYIKGEANAGAEAEINPGTLAALAQTVLQQWKIPSLAEAEKTDVLQVIIALFVAFADLHINCEFSKGDEFAEDESYESILVADLALTWEDDLRQVFMTQGKALEEEAKVIIEEEKGEDPSSPEYSGFEAAGEEGESQESQPETVIPPEAQEKLDQAKNVYDELLKHLKFLFWKKEKVEELQMNVEVNTNPPEPYLVLRKALINWGKKKKAQAEGKAPKKKKKRKRGEAAEDDDLILLQGDANGTEMSLQGQSSLEGESSEVATVEASDEESEDATVETPEEDSESSDPAN